ncbi:Proton-coupled folate transporter [Orchesella cincta]|uniref:Proton-coupled folate transporter n=1 Tax=Orchesella cincta TaxID=48709 RepID=A0A1D2N5T9_ORCCI|nr:Proton-coupled folate transporter [Orchesella cincta]
MQNARSPLYKKEEEEIQKVISEIGVWSEFIENFFPIAFSLFVGNWTDVYGVKIPFLLTISGVVFRYVGLLICTQYESWGAEIVVLFAVLPGSLTGGRIAISMLVYSFVAITSSNEDRTFRVGVLTAVRTFGRSAGSALGGHLKRSGKDYVYIFGLGGGVALAGFLYILLLMPNPKKGSNPLGFKQSKCDSFKNLFNLRSIIVAAKAFLMKREYGIREQLYLLVIILIFTMAPMQGEDSVLLLFVRNKLNWSTADYSTYGTFRMLIAFGGGLISIGILVKWLNIADWKLGVISCISQIAGSFVYAFAHKDYMMYVAPAVDILNGTMIIAARTMISKVIPIPEMGKVNSFVAVIDSTTPLWGNPMYNAIYRGTLENFPGAFFCVSAALTLPPLVLFSYFGGTNKGIPVEEQAARRARGNDLPAASPLPNSPAITAE